MPAVPELPEVEVLRRSLEPHVVGRRVLRIESTQPRLREPVPLDDLSRRVGGRRIVAVRRRAKYLLLDAAGGSTVVVHLGMSGQLGLVPESSPPERHEHVALHLDREERLRLCDPRRFGLVFVVGTDDLPADRHFRHLGIEPLSGELDGEVLRCAARRRRAPVKTFLMDSRVVVGIGNIYASESLYRAGIHPCRSVARISAGRWNRLAAAVVEVLRQAIGEGGTTLNDFADGEGNSGYFQVSLKAYGRAGQPCGVCGRSIRRRVQAGRSTFYCPRCQR